MRFSAILALSLFCIGAGLAACSSQPAPPPSVAVAPEAAPPPPAPGVIAGPIGQALTEKDRATAIAAQQDAVSSGARKSWRGERGAYGIVAPGVQAGTCRDYSHKIFVNGRPLEAKGHACLQNGEWRAMD